MNNEFYIDEEFLANDIGPFNEDETNWLEYINKMESQLFLFQVNDSQRKKIIFIAAVGEKILKMLNDIIDPKKIEEVTYEFIVEALENYFYPVKDTAFYIRKFQLREQVVTEGFFNYVVALRKLMINCRFPKKSRHSKLKNQILAGAKSLLKVKLNSKNMSLSEVLEAGLQFDARSVRRRPPHPRNHKARKNRVEKCFTCAQPKKNHEGGTCVFSWSSCLSCKSKGHVSLACKYKDVICTNCNIKGHISKLCKKSVVKPLTNMMNELSVTTEE